MSLVLFYVNLMKRKLVLALILSTASVGAIAVSSDSSEKDVKSIAWFTANVREARAQNKLCFDSPSLQASANCENALHALKIIYVGVGN